MLQLLLLHTRQVLSKILKDDDEAEEAPSSAEVYVKKMESSDMLKCLDGWEVSEGLHFMEKISLHILYHPSPYFSEKELFRNERNIPANQWSEKWREKLNICHVGSFLAIDRGAAGMFLKKLGIPHKAAGQGVIAVRPIGAAEVIGL